MASKDKPDNPEYEVGYGRPPRHSRFTKGQSGNPKGRPKGSLNLGTVLERTLRETVVINENGQRYQITKMEAAIKQLVNKSAAGDLGAIKFLAMLIRYGEEGTADAATPTGSMAENDRKVMESLMNRLGANHNAGANNESGNQ